MQTRSFSRSLDHVNWWDPEHWRTRGPQSISSVSLEGVDPVDIRNGWLTLPDPKARFQQKQLQERELKIASLYEAQQARALDRVRHSPSTGSTVTANGVESSPPPQIPHQPGKVRQMFEERRTKGIDKSYPLQPIHNTERTATKKALPNGYSKVTHTSNGYTKVTNTSSTTSKVAVERKNMKTSISSHEIKKQHVKNENLTNGSGDVNHNHETDINSNKHAVHVNGQSVDELDRVDNNYLLENETFPEALAPIPTPRSPEPKPPQRQRQTEPEPKKPPRRSPASKSSPTKTKVQPPPTAPPRRVISDNAVSENKARGAMQRAANPVLKRKAVASPVQSGSGGGNALKTRSALSSAERAGSAAGAAGDACSVCGRRFASDRLAKHEEICRRAHAKKRKPFDALKHRLAGTEAEPFINKLRKNTGNPSTTKVNKNLNNNWRQKHEEFISAIRAAKQVQAHLKAGGKLSDLPPPPPSENPDYVQCPHCNRRFNQAAAERHIPKCANFQFNKPKPTNKRR